MQEKQRLKGSLILILTAIIWGSGFVAQSEGMKHIGANTFNGIRMLIGSLILVPVILIQTKGKPFKSENGNNKLLLISSVVCGIILCAASTIQTWGLAYTTPGKSGFITAMYIIFVPLISIFMGKKITVRTVLCALLALFGMYLLCITSSDASVNFGDILTLVCALLFSLHIIVIDKYIQDFDPLKFSCLQFFVCGIINIIFAFILEKPAFDVVKSCAVPILYSGFFACGIGYTLQPVGQKYAEPTTASIIMSLESVFALIFGMIILGSIPTLREVIGCLIMFISIIIIQLPDRLFKRRKSNE